LGKIWLETDQKSSRKIQRCGSGRKPPHVFKTTPAPTESVEDGRSQRARLRDRKHSLLLREICSASRGTGVSTSV